MKFSIQTKQLKAALARLSALQGSRHDIPEHGALSISADLGGVTFSRQTPGGAIFASYEVEEIEGDGEFIAIRYDDFSKIVPAITSPTIEISTVPDSLSIRAGNASAKLSAFDPSALLPPLSAMKTLHKYRLPCVELMGLISDALGAASKHDHERTMQGITIRRFDERLAFIGTDRKRFHIGYMAAPAGGGCPDAMLPTDGARALLSALRDVDDMATLEIEENSLQVSAADVFARVFLGNAKLADITPVTKFDIEPLATINREAFANAVRAVMPISDGDFKTISLRFAKNALSVFCDRDGASAKVEVECVCKSDVSLSGNPAYILDALHAAHGEEIELLHLTKLFGFACKQEKRWIFVALNRPVDKPQTKEKGGEKKK